MLSQKVHPQDRPDGATANTPEPLAAPDSREAEPPAETPADDALVASVPRVLLGQTRTAPPSVGGALSLPPDDIRTNCLYSGGPVVGSIVEGHYEVTAEEAERLGFSPAAVAIMRDAARDPDIYSFWAAEAHAMSPDPDGYEHSPDAHEALTRQAESKFIQWIHEKACSVGGHLERGETREALYLFGYLLHGVEDLAAHAGRTNPEHASNHPSPDFAESSILAAHAYAFQAMAALREGLGEARFDQLRSWTGAGPLSIKEKLRVLGIGGAGRGATLGDKVKYLESARDWVRQRGEPVRWPHRMLCEVITSLSALDPADQPRSQGAPAPQESVAHVTQSPAETLAMDGLALDGAAQSKTFWRALLDTLIEIGSRLAIFGFFSDPKTHTYDGKIDADAWRNRADVFVAAGGAALRKQLVGPPPLAADALRTCVETAVRHHNPRTSEADIQAISGAICAQLQAVYRDPALDDATLIRRQEALTALDRSQAAYLLYVYDRRAPDASFSLTRALYAARPSAAQEQVVIDKFRKASDPATVGQTLCALLGSSAFLEADEAGRLEMIREVRRESVPV
jgi:hypothetical protein